MTVVATVNATDAKNRFGDLIRRAYQGKEHLIVERGGIPVVAIVPISDYQQLLAPTGPSAPAQAAQRAAAGAVEAQAREQLLAFLAQMHAQMPAVPAQEVEADIAQAIAAVRATASAD